jgi:SpoVK/Ycf46/Vps4 family AAA+-type ATPase
MHQSLDLAELAELIELKNGWEDLVLPDPVTAQLKELAAQVTHRLRVYENWGFGRKMSRGRGVSALFAGPSGAGKTLAAEVIGNHLALDLYRIDLAGVVSKYIGETEKNLRRIFDAAERSGAILFFDEADALFGKRSEVKDSHDRYANIEVAYLLQRMEQHRGLAILATNMKSHIDQAFLRRLRFVVNFPFPDSVLRRRIWERCLSPEALRGQIDLDALARLEITGGNIHTIALNAAFLAADWGRSIGMREIAEAARAEFEKIDKQLVSPELERSLAGAKS